MGSTSADVRARRAVQTIFFIAGSALSAWAPMVAYAQRRLALADATLGLVLLALGVGGLIAMPLTGLACHRFGSRRMVTWSAFCVPPFLPLLAWAPTAELLAVFLFAFGLAIGTLDVAMNTASVEVERASGRPLLSAIHALYSIGSLFGALATSVLLRVGISLRITTTAVCAALLLLSVHAVRRLPPSSYSANFEGGRSGGLPWRVVALGLLCFVAFVTEGAMLDWSAVYLQSTRGVAEHSAGFGYVAFATAMVAGRFAGDRVIQRIGPEHVIRYGALLSAAGLALAASVPSTAVIGLGFALVGLGAANVVPVLFGAAGRSSMSASAALALVAAIGNAGTLTGPAAIGAIAARSSLAAGFLVVAGALCVVALAAPIARSSGRAA